MLPKPSSPRRLQLAETIVAVSALATLVSNLPDRIIDFHRLNTRSPYSIPNWRFFGPSPGTVNVDLYVRYEVADRWNEWINTSPERIRSRVPALFNPGNRAQKVLIDIAVSLYAMDAANSDNFDHIKQSAAYRMLLAIGQCLPAAPQAVRGQVMLIESTPVSANDRGKPTPIVVTEPFDAT